MGAAGGRLPGPGRACNRRLLGAGQRELRLSAGEDIQLDRGAITSDGTQKLDPVIDIAAEASTPILRRKSILSFCLGADDTRRQPP